MIKPAGYAIGLIGFAFAAFAASAADLAIPSGRFLHISDIHFSPFDSPALAQAFSTAAPEDWDSTFRSHASAQISVYGQDTNHALLTSALAAVTETAGDTDFAIVTGDFLAHRFEEQTAKALAVSATSKTAQAFAAKTTNFVADALSKALPGRPVIMSLGNNDSSCGDYSIEPGGDYLAATKEVVRRLAGTDRVETGFDETYALGGYYAVRHPTVSGTLILVLNDVLWSSEYRDACGKSGLVAASQMMSWLTGRLRQQKESGGRVWLVHHIPVGIDPYSTVKSKEASCPAKVRSFLKEPFASAFPKLLSDFSDIIQASFTGHTHYDDYRLVLGKSGDVVGLEKIAPAISPVFGQNPGFHVFTYDRRSGTATDFSTTYLANLTEAGGEEPTDWQLEYAYREAYRQPRYSADSVAAVWQLLSQPGPVRETFRRLYNVSRGELDAADLPAYSCAIGHLDPQSFTRCYCGD